MPLTGPICPSCLLSARVDGKDCFPWVLVGGVVLGLPPFYPRHGGSLTENSEQPELLATLIEPPEGRISCFLELPT